MGSGWTVVSASPKGEGALNGLGVVCNSAVAEKSGEILSERHDRSRTAVRSIPVSMKPAEGITPRGWLSQMAHRELADWERCVDSRLTGAHGWALIIERKSRMNVVTGVRCAFCSERPPFEHEGRLFSWMFEEEKERRRSQSTPFVAEFKVRAA